MLKRSVFFPDLAGKCLKVGKLIASPCCLITDIRVTNTLVKTQIKSVEIPVFKEGGIFKGAIRKVAEVHSLRMFVQEYSALNIMQLLIECT